MVLTPRQRTAETTTTLSPLLLATTIAPTSAHPVPPPLRKSSTGSFSKISDFRLDGYEESTLDEGNGVRGVRHVELSIDAR